MNIFKIITFFIVINISPEIEIIGSFDLET
jgi:hypothetical protein